MNYLSTFTGIGGFEYGIQQAIPTARCVGYSEIDQPAIKTYEEHYEHENFGDITTINPAILPDFDLIVGGFPCQAFSVAGRRRGFDEARGTLFFDVARILEHKRPRHLVLENVKGLLSHDGGKTFQVILGILADLGYRIEWQVLNSKNFGVPQNRERIYIVGHFGDECSRQIFPLGEIDPALIREESAPRSEGERVRGSDLSATVDANYYKGAGSTRQMIGVKQVAQINKGQSGRVYGVDGISPTLNTMTGGGLKQPKIYDLKSIGSKTRRGVIKEGYAGTLDTRAMQAVDSGMRIRRLTPMECERLQGFPDDWTIGSDTQRYKQCGNAVTTNVVAAVMAALRGCLA